MGPYDFYSHPSYYYFRNAYHPYYHPNYPYYRMGFSYYSPECNYYPPVYNRYPILNDPPDVSGNWETYFGAGPTKSILNLIQQGNTVTGTYEFGSKKGKIQGTLSGYTLRGEWSQTPSYQYPNDRWQLVFDFTPQVNQPFDFTGFWSYGTNEPKRTPQFLWRDNRINSSSNWSGYIRTAPKGTFLQAGAHWNVPVISPSANNAMVSIWVGIDGGEVGGIQYLIQTGIKAEYRNNKPLYNAWYEVIPPPPSIEKKEIPLDTKNYPVSPGDRMYGEVIKMDTNLWRTQIVNVSKGWSFISKPISYNGPQQTAEFIVERPGVPNTNPLRLQPLAHFRPVTFGPCYINNFNPKFAPSERVVMHDGADSFITSPGHNLNITISTPSNPNSNGDGFTVAYGSAMPSPLAYGSRSDCD